MIYIQNIVHGSNKTKKNGFRPDTVKIQFTEDIEDLGICRKEFKNAKKKEKKE